MPDPAPEQASAASAESSVSSPAVTEADSGLITRIPDFPAPTEADRRDMVAEARRHIDSKEATREAVIVEHGDIEATLADTLAGNLPPFRPDQIPEIESL